MKNYYTLIIRKEELENQIKAFEKFKKLAQELEILLEEKTRKLDKVINGNKIMNYYKIISESIHLIECLINCFKK
jgi:hypothetical protein